MRRRRKYLDIAPGSEEENAHGERDCKDNMITINTILLYIFFCQYEEGKIKREKGERVGGKGKERWKK